MKASFACRKEKRFFVSSCSCIKSALALMHGFIICVVISGCAGKRWDEPLGIQENDKMQHLLEEMQLEALKCPSSFDADMKIFWSGPTGDRAIQGYTCLHAPSYLKLIVTNPLGQTVFAFSSNGSSYQILNPLQYNHIRGNVRSLAIRNEIPQGLPWDDWFSYLSGRISTSPLLVSETANDLNDETVWLKTDTPQTIKTGESIYLHLDPLEPIPLGYLFLDASGDVVAEISYGDQQNGDNPCPVQTSTRIHELPWGAEIRIELDRIGAFGQFKPKDFSLPVPPGFTTQLLP